MKKEGCVFCEKEGVFLSESFMARDVLGSVAPFHMLVTPRDHIAYLAELEFRSFLCFLGVFSMLDVNIRNISKNVGGMFGVEYGGSFRTVLHGHCHVIPFSRASSVYCKGYDVKNLFEEMNIPPAVIEEAHCYPFSKAWERMREANGEYILFVVDGKLYVFTKFSKEFPPTALSYRKFFYGKGLLDVPTNWKLITPEQRVVDTYKRGLTRALLEYCFGSYSAP